MSSQKYSLGGIKEKCFENFCKFQLEKMPSRPATLL